MVTLPIRAQFYAAETDYHDQVQRRFPVEAARVLGWMRTAEEIDEIRYRVEITGKRETVWTIEWRKGGSAVRKASVRYAEAALLSGPAWYRDVWKQLVGTDWAVGRSEGWESNFWEGAESAKLTRIEGLGAALKQVESGAPKTAAASSRLAGTLVQAAAPTVGSTVSLDGTILARAAAWLCVAEQQASHACSAEWAPILSLAGRAVAAKGLWEMPAKSSAVTCFWDVLVRMPAPADAFRLIVQPENRAYAAPVFLAYASIDPEYAEVLVEFVRKLYPDDQWKRLHDYGPSLNRASRNRTPIVPEAPVRSVRAWLGLLHQLAKESAAPEAKKKIEELVQYYTKRKADLSAPNPELVRLLNAGAASGLPLAPVAVVTPADLLSFSWEFGGLQIGSLHSRFSVMASGRPKAEELEKDWFGAVRGWGVFTQNLKGDPFEPLEDNGRYEGVISGLVAAELIGKPPEKWKDARDPSTIYFRRRWLMDPHRALEYLLQQRGEPEVASRQLRRVAAEGGERCMGPLLVIDNHYTLSRSGASQWLYDQAVDFLKMREELLRAVPHSIAARRELVEQKFADGRDPFGYAQALERLHWDSGIAFAPEIVFLNYVRANALESAHRFYDRWKPGMTNAYRFKEVFGPAAHALAVLEENAARQETILKDIDVSVGRDPEILAAVLKNEMDGARKHIEEWIKRYPRGRGRPSYEKLRDFLPLIPALSDSKHADHEKALDAFPTETASFSLLQYVLIQKTRLTPASAIRFLGGEDQKDPELQLLMAAVRKDRKQFEEIYQELLGPRRDRNEVMIHTETGQRKPDGKGILYAWLRVHLTEVPSPTEEPDLRPGNAVPLVVQLRELTAKKR